MNSSTNSGLFLVMAALFSMAIMGCGTTAHVEKDDAVNFKNYKTYSWVSEKEKSLKDRHSNNLIDSHVKAAVAKELQKNGWVETRSAPQVLLDYDIMVEDNVKKDNNPLYSRPYSRYYYNPVTRRIISFYYPSQLMGFESSEIPYKEGTLTLHMIDNSTNKLIWQGWSSDEVASRNFSTKELNSRVRAILKKFNPSEG
ncbi:MAG: DUF4136 domain-containing protein [Chitinophagaceae bacterium]